MPIHKAVDAPERRSPGMEPGNKKIDREKLKKACADFEGLFLAQMLKGMRRTIPQTGLMGSGPGKEIYQTLMDRELSRNLAQRGGMGLGKMLYKQVLRQEEKARPVSQEMNPFQPQGKRYLQTEEDHEGTGRSSASRISDD